jgi:hypothetical protein
MIPREAMEKAVHNGSLRKLDILILSAIAHHSASICDCASYVPYGQKKETSAEREVIPRVIGGGGELME